jgi:hypothetical protein
MKKRLRKNEFEVVPARLNAPSRMPKAIMTVRLQDQIYLYATQDGLIHGFDDVPTAVLVLEQMFEQAPSGAAAALALIETDYRVQPFAATEQLSTQLEALGIMVAELRLSRIATTNQVLYGIQLTNHGGTDAAVRAWHDSGTAPRPFTH